MRTDYGRRSLTLSQRLTKLKELGLGQTKITDAGLERLKTFTDLQTLGLEELSITDAGLEHLKALTRLQKLDLAGCNQIQDLKTLRCQRLTYVDLSGCGKKKDLGVANANGNLSEISLTPKNFSPRRTWRFSATVLRATRRLSSARKIVTGSPRRTSGRNSTRESSSRKLRGGIKRDAALLA